MNGIFTVMYLPYKSTKCRYTYNSPMDPWEGQATHSSVFHPKTNLVMLERLWLHSYRFWYLGSENVVFFPKSKVVRLDVLLVLRINGLFHPYIKQVG